MPTDAELAAYAQRLPPIYRDLLAAFPEIEPGRKAGYGLAFQTLAVHFVNRRIEHRLGEVQEACRRLADKGFIEIRNGIFAHPTELGERLIAILAGKRAPEVRVPELPHPTW
jgi:hypothetical protein